MGGWVGGVRVWQGGGIHYLTHHGQYQSQAVKFPRNDVSPQGLAEGKGELKPLQYICWPTSIQIPPGNDCNQPKTQRK